MTIEICEKSKRYLEEVFSRYTYNSLDDAHVLECHGRTILHLHAAYDTLRDDDDDAYGFEDALMFRLDIYDTEHKIKYSVDHKDEIEVNFPCRVRVFKDGNTMIILDKDCKLWFYQSVQVNEL